MENEDFDATIMKFALMLYSLKNFIMIYTPLNYLAHLKLKRITNCSNIKIDALPKCIKNKSNYDLSQLESLDIQDKVKTYVKEFISVLDSKNFPINHSTIYNNLNNLNIEIVDDFNENKCFKSSQTVGKHIDGKLLLVSGYEKLVIFHELFHFISSRGIIILDQEKEYLLKACGFQRQKFKKNDNEVEYLIGKGINEGYTDLLDIRYFNTPCESSLLLSNLAYLLELVIGKKEMEEAYTECNLSFIVESLTKYTSEKEAKKIIGFYDYIYHATYEFGGGFFTNAGIMKAYTYLVNVLVTFYIQKLESCASNNKKDDPYLIEKLTRLKSILNQKYSLDNPINLQGLSGKDIKKLEQKIDNFSLTMKTL